jgi:hypothetical protein
VPTTSKPTQAVDALANITATIHAFDITSRPYQSFPGLSDHPPASLYEMTLLTYEQ